MNANYTLLDILTNNICISNNGIAEKLIVENGIEIPMIQRDYAQGRFDEKTQYIRLKFLKDIHATLLQNQNENKSELNLDFVYGYVENSSFVPLDGQQRLTTLYIIHWFLAFKDDVNFEENGLNLFTYKTRQTSKEFLKSLNKDENIQKIKIECNKNYNKLICVIKNQPWFNLNWNLDPTVRGFLNTLMDVTLMFSDILFSTIKDKRPINFHFLEINEYGLGDNLYIKMNARGKSLSEFEKFKASFENIITNHINSKVFKENIDGDWLDTFWKFAIDRLPAVDIEDDVSILSNTCDDLLLSFIKKITEYIFFKENLGHGFNFNDENIDIIYSKEKNFNLLINSLNLIQKQNHHEWRVYFNELFSIKYEKDKVAINQNALNFVDKILSNENFSHFENVLFYAWLYFITEVNSFEITNDLKDFIRIIRNYANNINQKNKTSLDSELRTEYYHDILITIESTSTCEPYSNLNTNSISFRKEYIQFEIAKYEFFKENSILKKQIFKFEDHSTLRGLIFNFDFTTYNVEQVENIVSNFYALFEKNEYQDIIRVLLSFGDYSVKVGNSNLGSFRFFGQENRWHRILASPDGEINSNFKELFKYFSVSIIPNWEEFIENIVSEKIELFNDSWLWYCLNKKYSVLLDHPIYTKYHDGRVEIFYNQSLNSYHHNPFVFWFRYHSPENIRQFINEPDSCAQFSNFSRLHLKNGAQLEQKENMWVIHNLEKGLESNVLSFDSEKNIYILMCNNLIDDLLPLIESINNHKRIVL
jgi:hypothetical protein